MNKWQKEIVDRIRDDIKNKRDTVLSYRESHIAMNGILTDAALIDLDIMPEEVAELAEAKAEGMLVELPKTGIGDMSDGYHTFNELYHHRAVAQCKNVPGGSFCEYGYCDQRRVWERLKAYEDIGTVEEFAAYKQTVDYAKAKVKEIQDRIDARAGDNYHDETKRTLILEERQGAYITILEAAEAALAAKEEQG